MHLPTRLHSFMPCFAGAFVILVTYSFSAYNVI